MNCALTFHQGWTDIINSLPLIDYYGKKDEYDKVFVLCKEKAKEIVDYYIKDKDFVNVIYCNEDYEIDNNIEELKKSNTTIVSHGFFDRHRDDEFRHSFNCSMEYHFVKAFYENYNIPYTERIESFNLSRDRELEENFYNKFIEKYGEDYSLFHTNEDLTQRGDFINLNNITSNIFETIKVIENAKEIRLIDSIWASMIYLLDCKYNLFKDIKITICSFTDRSGGLLPNNDDNIIEPIHLPNWKIINCDRFFAICGDSGTGKTTLSKLLLPYFSNSFSLEGDRYHKWERNNPNWDSLTHLNPEANNINKMNKDVFDLKDGKSVYQVEYDHKNGNFTDEKEISASNVIVCGLHSLYNDNNLYNLKIYMDPDPDLKKEWKIKRDVLERGYKESDVIKSIEKRKEDFKKYIEPQRELADIIVNFFNKNDNLCLRLHVKEDIKINKPVSILDNNSVDYNLDKSNNYNIFTFEKFEPLISKKLPHKSETLYDYALLFALCSSK